MPVDVPLPRSMVLLSLALPGVLLTGWEIAARLSRRRMLRSALCPVLAIAAWLLAVHAAGLATRSFVAGLSIGTLGVAAGGVLGSLRRRASPAEAGVGRGPGLGALIGVAATTVPVAKMAFGWWFHDEDLITGHLSIPSEMLNDIYPPRHLTFADVPLHYHYGFDLLVAAIAAVTRVRVDTGVDVATVILWASTGGVLWALGDLWFGRGWVAVAPVLFAGGLPACAFGPPLRSGGDRLSRCEVGGAATLYPLVSGFFQHPWGLGIPFGLAVLLVLSAPDRTRRSVRLRVIALLLAALSIAHVVVLAAVLPSAVAAEAWRVRRLPERLSAIAGVLAAVGAAIGVALLLGGPPTSFGGAGAASQVLSIRRGVVAGLPDLARWHVQSYGIGLFAGGLGVSLLPRRSRLATALLAAGSAAVVDFVTYAHSGDIIKFGVVAGLALGLGAAASAGRILDAAAGRSTALRAGALALSLSLLAGASAGGLAYAGAFFTGEALRFYSPSLRVLGPDDARAAAFLRARVKAGEIVFRRKDLASGYALWAGLPVPWSDWGTHTFSIPEKRFTARQRLLETQPPEPGAYLVEGIRWFVLDPLDARLNDWANAWIASGRARVAAVFGALRVIELRSP